MQLVSHQDHFKIFFNEAIDKNRTNSHGSVRTKTEYGFLSVSHIHKKNQEFELTIFLPQVGDCIFFSWSHTERIKEMKYPTDIMKNQAFKILIKALEKNQDNLGKINDFGTSNWKGLYLRRSSNQVGKTGKANFEKAFNGSIPKTFIDKCIKAKVTLISYGKNPFQYDLKSLEDILNSA